MVPLLLTLGLQKVVIVFLMLLLLLVAVRLQELRLPQILAAVVEPVEMVIIL